MRNICSIEGCGKIVAASSLCPMHYRRNKLYGNPNIVIQERRGQTKLSEYNIYLTMKARCYNPKNEKYKDYGGRGIIICESWLKSFWNFIADMGYKPFPKAQIDRIDNDGNYEPDNCK